MATQAQQTPPANPATPGKPKFKAVRHVTKQLFKIKPGIEYYFRLTAPMHVGKQIDDAKEAATLCDCVDLATGEVGQIILSKLVREALKEQYPDDKYVGKCFALELMRVPDKRYNILKTFIEIEPSEAPQPTAPMGGKK